LACLNGVEKGILGQKAFDNPVTGAYTPAPRRRRVLQNTATGGVIRLDGAGYAGVVHGAAF
jgi:hypothetical protein